jgi:3-phenylpropionate/trans-cinnamate dioxygenase ferredoxin reductase component
MRTVVVVGANVAGGRAVEALRSDGFDGRVVLIGAEPDRPYERPPLSKEVVPGEVQGDSVFLRPPQWYDEQEIELRLGGRVRQLDPSGSVVLEDGTSLAFDACLLATGGRVRTLDVPGSELQGVHYLRTLQEANGLCTELARKPRVVVIGAGFIGAEIAASARMLGCEVTIIEVLDVPLLRVLGEEIGRVYAQIHRDHSVDLRLAEGVERFEGAGRVEAVVGTSGTRYPADLVVVGVGIAPNVELAEAAGIVCDNGVVVDERCRTSAANVFAAGDVARRPDVYSGGLIRPEHFQNAQNQGPAAARSMLGSGEAFQEVPWFWSDQYDSNLQMLGYTTPDKERVLRGSLESREFTAFFLEGDRVVAAIALNRGRDIAPTRRLIERRVTVDRRKLADDGVALKDLLRA